MNTTQNKLAEALRSILSLMDYAATDDRALQGDNAEEWDGIAPAARAALAEHDAQPDAPRIVVTVGEDRCVNVYCDRDADARIVDYDMADSGLAVCVTPAADGFEGLRAVLFSHDCGTAPEWVAGVFALPTHDDEGEDGAPAKGSPDLVGVAPGGHMVALEVKAGPANG